MKKHENLPNVVYANIKKEGKILLLRRANTGYFDGFWHPPAGHVEAGEALADAAAREAFEESGIIAAPGDLIFLDTLFVIDKTTGDPRRKKSLHHFFWAIDFQGSPSLKEPELSDAMDWFDMDKLPKELVPHFARFLELKPVLRPITAKDICRGILRYKKQLSRPYECLGDAEASSLYEKLIIKAR